LSLRGKQVLLILSYCLTASAAQAATEEMDVGRLDERLKNFESSLIAMQGSLATLVLKENENERKLLAFVGDREAGPVLMPQYRTDMQDIRILRSTVEELKIELKVRSAIETLVVALFAWLLNNMRLRLKIRTEGEKEST
jgi:hypothetical protein